LFITSVGGNNPLTIRVIGRALWHPQGVGWCQRGSEKGGTHESD
jgi:hypothetical protein